MMKQFTYISPGDCEFIYKQSKLRSGASKLMELLSVENITINKIKEQWNKYLWTVEVVNGNVNGYFNIHIFKRRDGLYVGKIVGWMMIDCLTKGYVLNLYPKDVKIDSLSPNEIITKIQKWWKMFLTLYYGPVHLV